MNKPIVVIADARDVKPADHVVLAGVPHRVIRVRQVVANFPLPNAASNHLPATELLHEIVDQPGLICSAIPHGAKIRIVVPV